MKVRKKRKRGWQAIKLDMSKAFDRVEWPYLEQIMRSLGFAERWIQLIMACVTSVQYEVLLNGSEAGRVSPTRGIRQGDPLSPYLFILCAEGLTAMIHDAERRRLLHDILGMEEIEHQGQYLGFPAYVGRSRSAAFFNLKSKFWARINEWRAQPLSRAGREVLIKSVLQALPTYVMGLFKLPKTLCTDLERIMNSYWWGGGEEEHKIHWLEWRRLAISKKHGGLGFRALHEFNMAMLGKQGWRLMTNPDSLAAQLLKAKYFPRTNFLHAVLKPGCSLTWRRNSEFCLQSARPPNCELRYVSDLIDDSSHAWNRDLIQNTFSSYEAHLILSLPISWEQCEDRWTWSLTRHGTYSVRSGYHCAMNMQRDMGVPSSSNASFGGNKVWNLSIPGKIKFFIWSAYRNVLPTRDNLQKKHILVELECPVCGSDMEFVVHCLLFCSVARAVWHGNPLSLRVSEFPSSSFADFFDAMCTELGKEQLELLLHGETKWKPPDEQTIKINVDGAVAEQRRVFGMGAVARDHCGEVLATMAYQGRDVAAAEIVEAYLGNVLSDCKLLMSSFLHCRVKHVRRTGNAVAHELAKRALRAEGDEFFRNEMLDYLAPFVSSDKLSM
ncbi:hypothetical protein SLEP1_g18408 [Rubroshorea leprosula]|uniref:Reverse transcriptase domain-containing protein n=1 Tax=Rubroshorea leprosula TaxID=152421 RepID=A0AAV5J396_9ROSI|nr:hypothetical protein SLEP1_g18408 [Rubroshorea leprosula]